jgi:hypothetical protein
MVDTLTEFLNTHGEGIHHPTNDNDLYLSFYGRNITWADEPLRIHVEDDDDNVACKYLFCFFFLLK